MLDGYRESNLQTYDTNLMFPSNIINKQTLGDIPLLIPTIRDNVPTTATTIYFLMRARDPDCSGITYVHWVVTGTADANASKYVGGKCGINPLTDITVDRTWLGS